MSETVEREALRRRIAEALARASPLAVPDAPGQRRAAVALVLRPGDAPGGPGVEALFVQRAEVERDPWSGHMALPGGRSEPADGSLLETARRETWEETGLELAATDFLGRLGDIHPRSRELPSIAVTPFVAWYAGGAAVRGNREIRDHVWIPLRALRDPSRRGSLALRRGETTRRFETIEYDGYTIWGLTFEIVREFLERLPRSPASGRKER